MTTTARSATTVRLAGEDSDGSIERFELAAAHRALALLKTNLGREQLLDLVSDEVAAGTAYMREQVERSAGEELTGTTTLVAHGITAAQFAGWLGQAFAREDVMIAGHPEHYSIHASGGRVNIVETLGDHVCSFFMKEWDEAATPGDNASPAAGEPTYGRRSRMVLEDDTVFGSISNSFRDEADGFTARLSVTLPASCGPEVIEHHLQHFAIEFHNWILRAAAEQAARADQ